MAECRRTNYKLLYTYGEIQCVKTQQNGHTHKSVLALFYDFRKFGD